jgi:hypothetical protein
MTRFRNNSQSRIAGGVAVRSDLKANAQFTTRRQQLFRFPIGKSLQTSTISLWKDWARSNRLPKKYTNYMVYGAYPDSNNYPYCQENHLSGARCVWNDFDAREDLGDLERDALAASKPSPDTVSAFRHFHELASSRASFLEGAASDRAPDYFLRSFAHVLRISFNRQQSMQDLYDKLVTTVRPSGQVDAGSLRVALHIRRSDSCRGGTDDIASPIDAPPMMTNNRKCYTASVYANALRRIYDKYKLPLEVYLSTDSNLQLIDELRGSNSSLLELGTAATLKSVLDLHQTVASSVMQEVQSAHPLLHESTSWRILNYSRGLFEIKGNVYDFVDMKKKQFLVESAVQDLWHLSHGEIFVGHLSSRYGKVAYLLAVARQDSAVPYVSPDGHNLCCETDEVCSVAKTKMSHMGDCLLYAHELKNRPCGSDYWTKGCGHLRDSPIW